MRERLLDITIQYQPVETLKDYESNERNTQKNKEKNE